MINSKKLFKLYNLKTWKQDKLQISLSIIAISIAVAILVSLQLILSFNRSYTNINAKDVNEGDINIQLLNSRITNEQLKVLEDLKNQGLFNYTTTYKIQNNLVSGDITSIVEVKFVDSKNYPIYRKSVDYEKSLQGNNVLINKVAADKFNLKKGDLIQLYIKGVSNASERYKVSDILENSSVIDESILGVIIINKSNLQQTSNGKLDELASNIHIVINSNNKVEDIKSILEKSFNSGVSIKTSEDVIELNKKTLNTENDALKLIEILVIIITGAGISVTTLLLTLKRKKDYVLFNVYGMTQELLKNLIVYETFIICIIGNIIGVILSFLITGVIEKSIIKQMDMFSIIACSIIPIISTVVFIMAQTLIFTMLPIVISKKINPISILRQENKEGMFDEDIRNSVFKMIIFLTISFSIYIKSITKGLIYISIILFLISIFYGITIGLINLITKINIKKDKYLLLGLRNLKRQKYKFALCSTALVLTIILCGIIVNLGYSIIPSVMKQYTNNSGYNLSVSTDFNDEIENVLIKEKYIKNYVKTIESTCIFKNANGKTIENLMNSRSDNPEFKRDMLKAYSQTPFKAIDLSKDMLKYSIMKGRWFTLADKNKNYVVLGNNFAELGINQGDEVEFDVQGQSLKFRVLGICKRDNINDNRNIYIAIDNKSLSSKLNASNSKLKYFIKCDDKNEKVLALNLSKKLKNVLIINERVILDQLSNYIQQLTYVFVCICCISIFSALCLIGNILMIINYERLKEFLVLNVLGAKNRQIAKITMIEGVIIGSISGVLGSLICEMVSYLIITNIFDSKYSVNFKLDFIMILGALMLTIASSLIVIKNLHVQKYTVLLRTD